MPNNLAAGVFHRFEKKFILTHEQYAEIAQTLCARMKIDDNNKSGDMYHVRSLYYDTPHNSLISEALSTPRYKEKVRLRAYGKPQRDDIVFVEIKKKVNGVGSKRRIELPLNDAYMFLDCGRLPCSYEDDKAQVMREIYAILSRNGMNLRPSALISYSRLALDGLEDKGLRITFDSDLRGQTHDLLLESEDRGTPIIDSEHVVMEVKAPAALPLWLTRQLSHRQTFARKFSKYRAIYQKTLKTEVSYVS